MKKNKSSDLSSIEPGDEELSLISYAYALRHRFWPHYTWDIQTMQLKDFDKSDVYFVKNNIDIEKVKKNSHDLFDKINASFYHFQMLKENEELITEVGRKIAKASQSNLPTGVLGIAGMPYEPINYEYEAMLVTLKSAIDIIVAIVAPICGLSDHVDTLSRLLKESEKTKQPNEFHGKLKSLLVDQKYLPLFEEFQWNGATRSKRDHAVHKGSLSTGTINIQYTSNIDHIGVLKSKAVPVGEKMSDIRTTPDLEEYCASLFYLACDFLMDVLQLVVNRKLERGQKMSIYEWQISVAKAKQS